MTYLQPDSKTIQTFFDSIAERYDFLNSFLSFSMDAAWRRRAATLSLCGHERSFLDIGAGTGKSIESFMAKSSNAAAVGLDFSFNMLTNAKGRVPQAKFVSADMHQLPFGQGSFDLVTSSFVLRSVKKIPEFLDEVRRVLSKKGRIAFLDLTRPKNRLFWNLCYYPYLKCYIPLMGKLFAKNKSAYQFLSDSIQNFLDPEEFAKRLERAGFCQIQLHRFCFGAATLILAEKNES